MRKQELDSWLKEGGSLPMELTNEERFYLNSHGAFNSSIRTSEGFVLGWQLNAVNHGTFLIDASKVGIHGVQNYFKGKRHGTWKTYAYEGGELIVHKEYAYGILLKDYLEENS